ncbi:hypothetical protein ACWGQ2_17935 [Arthrobacter sp. NPDC055585]
MLRDFKPVRDAFEKVADDIYAFWDKDDSRHLGPASAEALRANREQLLGLSPTAMLQWALRGELPQQSWSNDFGDPALTLVDRPDFRVDVLYWDHNASPTHKHVSCGAFMAHHGDRLHQHFTFELEDQIDDHLSIGKLLGVDQEAMNSGGVREIQPHLIHDLFWLQRPSVTVSIRCKDHPGAPEKPNDFWSPGIQVLDMVHHETPIIRRKISTLQLLRNSSPRMFEDEVTSAVVEGSPLLSYQTLIYLSELNDAVATPESVRRMMQERGDEVSSHFVAGYEHFRRKSELSGIYTADRAAQALVALMWAGTDGQDTERVMAEYVPEVAVEKAAELAVNRVSSVDPQLADLLRARAAEILPALMGTC